MMIVSWQIIFIVYRFPITVCLPQSNLSSQIDKLNVKNASVNKLFIVHHILLLVAIVISNFMMRLRYGRKKSLRRFFWENWMSRPALHFIHSFTVVAPSNNFIFRFMFCAQLNMNNILMMFYSNIFSFHSGFVFNAKLFSTIFTNSFTNSTIFVLDGSWILMMTMLHCLNSFTQ